MNMLPEINNLLSQSEDMSAHGTIRKTSEGYSVQFERILPYSAEKVWNALTNPALLHTWLAETETDWQPGSAIALHFTQTGNINEGVIISIRQASLLEYTWQHTGTEPSLVRWELQQDKEGQCNLTLTHSLLKGDVYAFAAGWHVHLRLLNDVLAGRLQRFEWFEDEWKLEYAYYAGDIA